MLVAKIAAQQLPIYSQSIGNQFSLNPAYAGHDDAISISGAVRKQWTGLQGSPLTQNINVHLPLYYINSGVGLAVERDVIGVEENISAAVAYQYTIQLNKTNQLSAGLGIGIMQKTLDGTKLRTPEGVYEGSSVIHNDVLLQAGKMSEIAPITHFGIYYTSNKFFGGAVIHNLIEGNLKYQTNLSLLLKRHYTVYIGYKFNVMEELTLQPSMLYRTLSFGLQQIETNIVATYNDKFLIGIGYRGYSALSNDALIGIIGTKLNERLSLAYSYDYTTSPLQTTSNGSHELLLNYKFKPNIGKGKPANIIYNPRFL
ncbi:MAG: type IX secretion system membrane protein PorP/SprF [Saprospiraceae bacterium]|nr:type IX secretion system membrane protein PorP/SprF [Saprospiraceae bacterium]